MQLQRMINTYLSKQKETASRALSFKLPRLVSLSADVRMIEDDCSAVSLLDIYKMRVKKLHAIRLKKQNQQTTEKRQQQKQQKQQKQLEMMTSSEAADLPLQHYLERIQQKHHNNKQIPKDS